ncbi:MAG: DUF3180 domain-containing protein [Kineosporiaceae bacterium]|nr:DUF3180 domain-containing protein [Kineosporiaceae bacterium]
MRATRLVHLLLIALTSTGVGWIALDTLQRNGSDPLPVPWTAPAGLLVLAAVVLGATREVRRWVTGRRRQALSPLAAARIAVLAAAASYVGAGLAGWYSAQALVALRALVGNRRELFWLAVASAVTALVLTIAGLVGQRWCRRPPSEEDEGA